MGLMEELINKKIVLLLKQFSLADQEIEAYMFLLREGKSSVPKLAKYLKTSKSSTYYLVEKLKRKGFICESIQGKKHLLKIDDPKKMKYLMEEQDRRLRMKKLNVNSFLIPTLERIKSEGKKSVDIKFFEGKRGVKKGMFEILVDEKVKEVYALFSLKRQEMLFFESFLCEFYEKLTSRRCKKKFLITEAESCCISKFKESFFAKKSERNSVSFRKMPILHIHEDIYVFGDSVLFINLDIKGSYAVVFFDKALAMTLKSMFKIVWEVSENFE